jgi:hypothetical protein
VQLRAQIRRALFPNEGFRPCMAVAPTRLHRRPPPICGQPVPATHCRRREYRPEAVTWEEIAPEAETGKQHRHCLADCGRFGSGQGALLPLLGYKHLVLRRSAGKQFLLRDKAGGVATDHAGRPVLVLRPRWACAVCMLQPLLLGSPDVLLLSRANGDLQMREHEDGKNPCCSMPDITACMGLRVELPGEV